MAGIDFIAVGSSLGCNSSYFYPNHPSLCTDIGGDWKADIKWCQADNKTELDAMIIKGQELNISPFCKSSSYNANGASLKVHRSHRIGLLSIVLVFMMMIAGVDSAVASLPTSTNITIQDRPAPCIKRVEKVGNGDPHPSCKFHQVTGNLDCNHQDCQSSHAEGREFSWSVAGTGGGPFATLGFDVSESYSTENTYSCSPKDGAQKICVFALVSYLEDTAKEVVSSGDCLSIHASPYVIRAPDKGHRQNFRCEVDANCHALDYETWEHNQQPCP